MHAIGICDITSQDQILTTADMCMVFTMWLHHPMHVFVCNMWPEAVACGGVLAAGQGEVTDL